MSRTASICLGLCLAAVLTVGAPSGAQAGASAASGAPSLTEPAPEPSPEPEPDPEPEPEPEPPLPGPGPGGPVLVVGDSLTWRGAEELVDGRRGWTVDGLRGRNVRELLPVLRGHLGDDPRRYRTVVIALGTNTARRWRKRHYAEALGVVPVRARTVLVTPYRAPRAGSSPAAVERTGHYAGWMAELAAARPRRRCLADWRAAAIRRPALLVDGVHQTAAGEHTWARLVDDAVTRCAAG